MPRSSFSWVRCFSVRRFEFWQSLQVIPCAHGMKNLAIWLGLSVWVATCHLYECPPPRNSSKSDAGRHWLVVIKPSLTSSSLSLHFTMHQQNSWVKDPLNPLQNYQHKTCNFVPPTHLSNWEPPNRCFFSKQTAAVVLGRSRCWSLCFKPFLRCRICGSRKVRCVWLVTSARKNSFVMRWKDQK